MNGSIILCDHVYESKDGKFIISGTYNQWNCKSNYLKIPHLHCYVRIYPERTGPMQATIELRDDNQAPNHGPIMKAELQLEATSKHIPVMEFAFNSMIPAEIKAHFAPDSPKGSKLRIPLSLILTVEGEMVATSPLAVVFTKA